MIPTEPRWYDLAQICSNGHVANMTMKETPEQSSPYCDKCGHETITECPACNTSIRGQYRAGVMRTKYRLPHHCHQCGKAYPWTERKKAAALEMFAELLDMENEQKEELSRDLDAIATEQPRTQVAAVKVSRMIAKVGKEAGDLLRGVLVEIVSETAKKVIWPNG